MDQLEFFTLLSLDAASLVRKHIFFLFSINVHNKIPNKMLNLLIIKKTF